MSDLFDRHVEANLGGGDNPVGQGDSYAHSSPLLFVKKAHLEEQAVKLGPIRKREKILYPTSKIILSQDLI